MIRTQGGEGCVHGLGSGGLGPHGGGAEIGGPQFSNAVKGSTTAVALLTEQLPCRHLQREDIMTCIQEYAEIAVWTVEKDVDGNPVVHLPQEDAMVA